MARKDDEDDDDDFDEDAEEKKSTKKKKKSSTGKAVFVPRAVSIPEMFNIISDKLDMVLEEVSK